MAMTPDGSPDARKNVAAPARVAASQPAGRQRLGATARVRQRKDYLAAYEHGRRVSGSLMSVFFHKNSTGESRLGIAATRKIGGAVGRNRAKRRVREVFRLNRLPEALDVVVIPRRELITAPFERIEAEFRNLLKRRRGGTRG